MKSSKLLIVAALSVALALTTLWKNSLTETHGVTAGSDLKSHAPATNPAPAAHASHLVLVEFFAGY